MPVFNDSNAVLPARPNVAHNVMMLFTGPGNESNAWATPGGTLGDGADKRAHGTQSGRERAAERARQLAHHARQIGEHGARVTHRVKHLAEPVADTGTEIVDSTTGLLQHATQPSDALAYDLARVTEHRASVSFNEYAASPISLKALRILSCASCAPALQASKVSWNLMV